MPIGEQPIIACKSFDEFEAADIDLPVNLRPAYAMKNATYEVLVHTDDDRAARRRKYKSVERRSLSSEVGVFKA